MGRIIILEKIEQNACSLNERAEKPEPCTVRGEGERRWFGHRTRAYGRTAALDRRESTSALVEAAAIVATLLQPCQKKEAIVRHFVLALVFFCLSACGLLPTNTFYFSDTADRDGEQGGGASVQLPFPRSEERLCVQGAYGAYSHTGNSTSHDLDFDTSNYEQEEIYAPEAGVVRVHLESATTNFGYHINLDLGDGTYLVLGHFSEIFVADGDEVAPGTLLGYEGCTGLCTGDHLHYGRHEGDASLQAQYGTSVATNIRAADATAEEEYEDESSDDFVCDEASGHWYFSDLAVPLWHPDGALIKAPASPEVYLVDEGSLVWLRDEDVFWSHGYDFANLTLVSNEELACYGDGGELSDEGLVDAYTDEFGFRWLVVGAADDSARYRQMVAETAWEGVMTSWGLTYSETNPPLASEVYLAWPEQAGHARFRDGALVKEDSRSDVYVITHGVAAPIIDWNTYLLAGFYQRDIIFVSDGAVAEVQEEVGDCSVGLWCLTAENLTACGGGFDLSGAGDYGGDDTDDTDGCTDNDSDGHCSEASGGDDCWDYNPYVYPGAEEICGNGWDDDCSGSDEACPETETDSDGDGVMNAYDNCPVHDNPDQSDIDGDGAGDSCDTDMDGDGVLNSDDCDMDNPLVSVCDTGEDGVDTGDYDHDDDDDSDVDSDTDTDSDTDSDADTDSDTDTGLVDYGIMTVTWETDFGYNSQTLTAIYEYAPSEAEFEGWAGTTFTATNNDEITFSFLVPEGQTVRYSVEAYSYGLYDWSCESTSYDEADDELKGTHTIEFAPPSDATCDLSPSMYLKTAGTADGCEAMVLAECD